MARQPALNEEALVQLGPEKLSRLVIDEAKRNAPFRKLVTAALAATKGPAAVATIVDRRLAGLDSAQSVVDWEKSKDFTNEIAATVATITGELAAADPAAAADRLVRFLSTADRVFERVDDPSGRLKDAYRDAAGALPNLVRRLEEGDEASVLDRLFALIVADVHHLFSGIISVLFARLPANVVENWDERLAEAERAHGPVTTPGTDWKKQANGYWITRLRQAIADRRRYVDVFITPETIRPQASPETIAIAERLCDAGRHKEALHLVRKRGRPNLKVMTHDELTDDSIPRDVLDLPEARLEIRILDTMGDRQSAQDLRWKSFAATLDLNILREHIAQLPDFAEYDVLDNAFAHVSSFKQKERALAFFLNWPRLDLAAKLVVDRRAEWEGRYYQLLLVAAETLESIYPNAATILYRALLDDILDRGRASAYGHAARYLETLDALANQEDATSGLNSHPAYCAELLRRHGQKRAFWSLVKVG
jgi:uncharacterized protein DUF6880